MRLLSLIAVFLLYSMSVFTQSINVSIRDINNNPIAAVDILNKDKEIVGERIGEGRREEQRGGRRGQRGQRRQRGEEESGERREERSGG